MYLTALESSSNILVGSYGHVINRPGTKYIHEVQNQANRSYLYPFKYSSAQSYILEFANTKLRFYKNQAVIGAPYEVTTPYSSTESADLSLAQSYDTVYIANGSHAVRKLVRTNDTSWALTTVTYDEPAYLRLNQTATTLAASATSGTGVTITASAPTFVNTDVGRHIRYLSGPDTSDAVLYNDPLVNQIYFDIPFYPQSSTAVEVIRLSNTGARTALTYTAGAPGANEFTISSGTVQIAAALTTDQKLIVQRKNTCSGIWGNMVITGYTSSTQVTVTIINELSGTNASTLWRLGAWSETTGYPRRTWFYNGRLFFANTPTFPNGIWASGIEDFENISPDDDFKTGLLTDESPLSAEVTGIISIDFAVAADVTILGGEGLKSINKAGTTVTAANISQLIQNEEATNCAAIQPAKTKNEIIFADAERKNLLAIGYTYQTASYKTKHLNMYADHMFEASRIKQIVYVENPTPMIWVLKDDGTLVAGMYSGVESFAALTNCSIAGDAVVESIAAISYNDTMDLYMVVNRTIDGGTTRYIEILAQPFFNDEKETCIYLDSSVQYNGVSTSTLTGLDHLEGEEVRVMGDGAYNGDYTVASGSITIAHPVLKATIGLAYLPNGKTLPSDSGKRDGAAVGSLGIIPKAFFDFYETDGCRVGYTDENLQEINFRPAGVMANVAYPVQSGVYEKTLNTSYQRTTQIYFEQPYPLPFTLRSITFKLKMSSN